jgi:hypothetical protein
MKRRQFIQLVAGGVLAWPSALRAQMSVVGYLSARSPEDTGHLVRRGSECNGGIPVGAGSAGPTS